MLSDEARLSLDHRAPADSVQQGGLAVIYMTQDAHDRLSGRHGTSDIGIDISIFATFLNSFSVMSRKLQSKLYIVENISHIVVNISHFVRERTQEE